MANEELLTQYLILTSGDEGHTWKNVGKQLARSSDAALRAFFSDPPKDGAGLYVAVSINRFRPQMVAAKVKTSLSEFDMPEAKQPEPEQAAEQQALA